MEGANQVSASPKRSAFITKLQENYIISDAYLAQKPII